MVSSLTWLLQVGNDGPGLPLLTPMTPAVWRSGLEMLLQLELLERDHASGMRIANPEMLRKLVSLPVDLRLARMILKYALHGYRVPSACLLRTACVLHL